MKYSLLTVFIFLQITIAVAGHYPTNLAGKYKCKGAEVGKNEHFDAWMKLTKTGETYTMISRTNDGSSYVGTGIYDYAKHSFSLLFINPKASAETGLGVGGVKTNNTITSEWTYLNKTTLARSICIKI